MLFRQFEDFLFLYGSSLDLFDHFEVDFLHGLERSKCYDFPHDSYITGLTNFIPNSSAPFLFINEKRFRLDYRGMSLIMHECFHLALLQFCWDLGEDAENEEFIVEYAEKTGIRIFHFLAASIE